MKKHFNPDLIWNKDLIDYKGLPRPYFFTDPKFYKINDEIHLHKKIPIPWQSKPLMTSRPIDLILENEERVYSESLCAYCGITINQNEECVRWKNNNTMITQIGPGIASDVHPFHKECMKQARIFCPHMRKTKDCEFEWGPYWKLRANADLDIIKIKGEEKMENNIVEIINDFVSEEDCNIIVKYMDSQTDQSFWNPDRSRQMMVNIEAEEVKPILLKYLEIIKKKYNREDLYIAEYMLSRYNKGFFMPVHIDIEDGREYFNISCVAYLNNEFEGGDIVFPNIKLRHAPKKGDMALFLSNLEEAVHGVEVVTSGVRYVMPIWITYDADKGLPFLHS